MVTTGSECLTVALRLPHVVHWASAACCGASVVCVQEAMIKAGLAPPPKEKGADGGEPEEAGAGDGKKKRPVRPALFPLPLLFPMSPHAFTRTRTHTLARVDSVCKRLPNC